MIIKIKYFLSEIKNYLSFLFVDILFVLHFELSFLRIYAGNH